MCACVCVCERMLCACICVCAGGGGGGGCSKCFSCRLVNISFLHLCIITALLVLLGCVGAPEALLGAIYMYIIIIINIIDQTDGSR